MGSDEEEELREELRWTERVIRRHQYLLVYVAVILTLLLVIKIMGIT